MRKTRDLFKKIRDTTRTFHVKMGSIKDSNGMDLVNGVTKSRTQLSDFTFTFSLSCIGEGNGNPLQCSCLENPRDSGAWWAAVYGVAQSQTQLKRLSSSRDIFNFTAYF